MKKIRVVKREVEITDDIICNKCGASCIEDFEGLPSTEVAYGLIEAEVEGGYYSTYLEDQQSYTFSLCEKCLKELFDKFVIPPESKDIIPF
jgi:hypothetical protein